MRKTETNAASPSSSEVVWTKVNDLSRISTTSEDSSSGVTWKTLESVLIMVGAFPNRPPTFKVEFSESLSVETGTLVAFSLANPSAGLAPGRP